MKPAKDWQAEPTIGGLLRRLVGVMIGLSITSLILLFTARDFCTDTEGRMFSTPSGFCRATHLWDFPGSIWGVLLVTFLYSAPVFVVVLGAVGAQITKRRAICDGGVALAFVLLAIQIVLLLFANVRFPSESGG
ncbi:MAG: hypothetical protein WB507_05935 [Solirubrobacterales bacterium]